MLSTRGILSRPLADLGTYVLVALTVLVLGVSTVRTGRLATLSYSGDSASWLTLSVFAAVAWLAGAFMVRRPNRHVATALVWVSLLWTIPDWAGWPGSGTATTFAAQSSALLLPVAALAATLQATTLRSRRWSLVTCMLVLASGAVALVWDSLAEPGCWRACRPAVFGHTTGHWPVRVVLGGVLVAACFFVGSQLLHPRRHVVDALTATLGAAVVIGLIAQVLPPATVVETASGPPRTWAFLLSQVAALMLAALLLWRPAQTWLTAIRLNRLAVDIRLVGTPTGLQDALRDAVRDPDLTVTWWSESRSTWVDSDGREVPEIPGADLGSEPRTVTKVTRDGVPLAAVRHRASLSVERLLGSLRPAVVLSFENAHLQAAARAELHTAREAAFRLVERSEQERRTLQGNLHDGAQQRLVGLTMSVHRIRVQTIGGESGRASREVRTALDRADVLVREVLVQVRGIGHGIHPHLLADLGLVAALRELADISTDVVLRVVDDGVHGPPEHGVARDSAAYSTVARALDDARLRHATRLEVRLRRESDETLSLLLLDDGDDGSAAVVDGVVDDRLTAIGSRLRVEARRGGLVPEEVTIE
jgi:signal transduction histidine kinase